jgi:hypothetical protein
VSTPPGGLVTALRVNNRNDDAGRLMENEETRLVRAEGQIRTLTDIRAILWLLLQKIILTMSDFKPRGIISSNLSDLEWLDTNSVWYRAWTTISRGPIKKVAGH